MTTGSFLIAGRFPCAGLIPAPDRSLITGPTTAREESTMPAETHTEAHTEIRDFITRRFPAVEITDADDIFSLGFVNSLFAMELVMFIEKHFSLTIPSTELRLENFRTVNSMAALIERQAA